MSQELDAYNRTPADAAVATHFYPGYTVGRGDDEGVISEARKDPETGAESYQVRWAWNEEPEWVGHGDIELVDIPNHDEDVAEL